MNAPGGGESSDEVIIKPDEPSVISEFLRLFELKAGRKWEARGTVDPDSNLSILTPFAQVADEILEEEVTGILLFFLFLLLSVLFLPLLQSLTSSFSFTEIDNRIAILLELLYQEMNMGFLGTDPMDRWPKLKDNSRQPPIRFYVREENILKGYEILSTIAKVAVFLSFPFLPSFSFFLSFFLSLPTILCFLSSLSISPTLKTIMRLDELHPEREPMDFGYFDSTLRKLSASFYSYVPFHYPKKGIGRILTKADVEEKLALLQNLMENNIVGSLLSKDTWSSSSLPPPSSSTFPPSSPAHHNTTERLTGLMGQSASSALLLQNLKAGLEREKQEKEEEEQATKLNLNWSKLYSRLPVTITPIEEDSDEFGFISRRFQPLDLYSRLEVISAYEVARHEEGKRIAHQSSSSSFSSLCSVVFLLTTSSPCELLPLA
jgi:hypothetical protein